MAKKNRQDPAAQSTGPSQPTMRLRTEAKLAAGGDALARHPDGRVIFVQGAAPNEEVDVRIRQDNKSFVRAQVTKIIEASDVRVKPTCPHFRACGGCSMQHISYDAQLKNKQDWLRDALVRMGKVDLDKVEIEAPWSGSAYGYRTRVRLVASKDGKLGFRAPKSRHVVDVRQCPVLSSDLQDVLNTLRAALQTVPLGKRDKSETGDSEISLVSNDDRVLGHFPPSMNRIANTVAKSSGPTVHHGDEALEEATDSHGPLFVSPRVFAQASRQGNSALIGHLKAILPESSGVAVELFSGSGNFTRVIADRATKVEAFEGSREAVALARRSAAEHVEVHLGSVEERFSTWLDSDVKPDLIVLDPPRVGIEDSVVKDILRAQAGQVIYVSCNPATFARDAQKFEEGGLKLTRVRLFDLYPQTGHAEIVGVFKPTPEA